MTRIMELADARADLEAIIDDYKTLVSNGIKAVRELGQENAQLKSELMEQARLNGMGGERELRLMAENERYRAALEMIAGKRLCLDPLMSNADIAKAVLGETK